MSGAWRDYEVLRRRRMQENMQENTMPAMREWTLRCHVATAISREMIERFGSWLRENFLPSRKKRD